MTFVIPSLIISVVSFKGLSPIRLTTKIIADYIKKITLYANFFEFYLLSLHQTI